MATLDVVPERLGQGLLGTSPTLIYTVPGAPVVSATIRSIVVTNLTEDFHAASLWLVPTGSAVNDSTALVKNTPVSPTGVLFDDGVHVLMTGGQVWGSGDAVSVFTLTVDGAESVTA